MSIKERIKEKVKLGMSRVEAIASMGLGERSAAAYRALESRQRVKDLVQSGVDIDIARKVVREEKLIDA